jgi:hypothetical protein
MYVGAGILGKVGGDMMLTDTFARKLMHPSNGLRYGIDAVLIGAIIAAGRLFGRHRTA